MPAIAQPLWRPALLLVLLLSLGLASQGCAPGGPRHFQGDLAYLHVEAQLAIGPRAPASDGSQRVRQYISDELSRQGWAVQVQSFTFRGTLLHNVIARRGEGPIVLLGAHYDTRRYADRDPDAARRKDPVPGADDGASGVSVLLELGRVLGSEQMGVQVWLAFFDGEDQGGIDDWPWSVGAEQMARSLTEEETPQYVVIADMVGDFDQRFYWEGYSDSVLREEIWSLARDLGYGDAFTPTVGLPIVDDHLPFLQRGVRAVDIIDVDYPYWHTVADTADKVSPQSLERVGRVLEELVRQKVGLEQK